MHSITVKNEGHVPLIYEWQLKENEPKYTEKSGINRSSAVSLVSVGMERPRVLPLLHLPFESVRPQTAITTRFLSEKKLLKPRPLSSSGILYIH